MASIFDSFKVNLNPWDEESVHYENRAKPIMNRRFDVVEKQNDYQATLIEDSLADHQAERKRSLEISERQHKRAKQREDDQDIEALIASIVSLEDKASKAQANSQQNAAKAWQHQANAKKVRYKDLTGVEWGTL